MSGYIMDLQRVAESGRDAVGCKAANLASLLAAGFPVPSGFCLATAAFQHALAPFREHISASLRGRDLSRPEFAEHAARTIQSFLERLVLPDDVARELDSAMGELDDGLIGVRSSATAEDLTGASFAGQYETVLGVRGVTQLYAAVLTCWRSFYSAHAIAGRATAGFSDDDKMAVLIQPMIDAECAGVCYSVDPVQMRRDLIVINAAWGTGAGVVDGSIPSDTYWLSRLWLTPERRHISEKAEQLVVCEGKLCRVEVPAERQRASCLPASWAQSVGEVAVLAERHFGTPQDVEWAIAEQKLWILQSRPITGLPEHLRRPDDFPVSWDPAEDSRRRWYLWWECREQHDPVQRVPLPLEHDYRDLVVTLAREDACRILGDDHHSEESKITNGRRYQAKRRSALGPGDLRVRARAHEQMSERLLDEHALTGWDIWGPEIIARTRQLHDFDLHGASDADLAVHLEDAMGACRRHWMLHSPLIFTNPSRYFSAYAALTGKPEEAVSEEAWSLAEGNPTVSSELVDALNALGVEARKNPNVAALVRTPAPDARARIMELRDAAPFLVRLDAFLDRFGERNGAGRGSVGSLLTPTWGEKLETVLALIAPYLDPAVPDPALARSRAQAERDAQVERLCAACPSPAAVAEFRRQLALAQRLAEIEETHNHYIDQLSDGQLRLATLEAGRRLASTDVIDEPEDIWWLRRDEILDLLRDSRCSSQMDVIWNRRADYARWELLTPSPVLGVPEQNLPPRPTFKDEIEVQPVDDGVLRGQGGSRGRGSGPARVIGMGETAPKLQPGDVLVSVNAGPAWTAYFPILAGVVLDEGSFAEHSTGIAREYGIPVVFDTRDGSKRIPEGTWITVDGLTGAVELS